MLGCVPGVCSGLKVFVLRQLRGGKPQRWEKTCAASEEGVARGRTAAECGHFRKDFRRESKVENCVLGTDENPLPSAFCRSKRLQRTALIFGQFQSEEELTGGQVVWMRENLLCSCASLSRVRRLVSSLVQRCSLLSHSTLDAVK
eukprot:3229135-Rhodomonas_salina.3